MALAPSPKSQWFLWLDGFYSPYKNMAVDESLYANCSVSSRPLLRIYSWDRKSLSLGYFQQYNAADRREYEIVRRPTGGGTVHHTDDLTYSLIIPCRHTLYAMSRRQCYQKISTLIVDAFKRLDVITAVVDEVPGVPPRPGVNCFDSPVRSDILAGDRKIAGAAQKRNKYGLLHQGSIHYQGIAGVNRINLTQALLSAFRDYLNCDFETYIPPKGFFDAVEVLVTSKYDTDTWNKRR